MGIVSASSLYKSTQLCAKHSTSDRIVYMFATYECYENWLQIPNLNKKSLTANYAVFRCLSFSRIFIWRMLHSSFRQVQISELCHSALAYILGEIGIGNNISGHNFHHYLIFFYFTLGLFPIFFLPRHLFS